MNNNIRLSEFLCTRLCHDMIGPVGAVNNGVEFLREESPNMQSQAADLIESSAREAVARVQFYRQAYGYSSGGETSIEDVKKLADNFFASSKIRAEWPSKADISLSSAKKKLLLNLLILAMSALIRGGQIKIEIDQHKFAVSAEGQKAALDANYAKTLRGEINAEELDSRLVQCQYTYLLLQENGWKLQIDSAIDRVLFSVLF